MSEKLIDTQELIDNMRKQFEESPEIKTTLEAAAQAAKESGEELTDENREAIMAQGRKILNDFQPMIIKLAELINDPSSREELQKNLHKLKPEKSYDDIIKEMSKEEK
ncbi:MAG: hypothetical protein CME70_06125 [Halobacteriovorax sp.]|nr:hypothetical protein [Halobacteriovorax sp.]|tara:strand:- start:1289 stop:1612 length:324 start_codon:yes stop_codon:yes gene_type:complete